MSEPAIHSNPMISRRAGRRIGYVVAIVVNLLIYGFINAWPGWDSFDFITPAAADVVPLVNLSVTVAILVNIVYLFADGTRVRALGEIVALTAATVASAVVLNAFPFDFSAYTFPWAIVVRIVLVIAIVGSGISVLVNLYRLIRGPRPQRPPTAVTP